MYEFFHCMPDDAVDGIRMETIPRVPHWPGVEADQETKDDHAAQ